MSCVRPLDGFRTAGGAVVIVERGGRAPRNSLTKVAFPVPCGKCVGCRMSKSEEWGVRCMHEAKMWSHSCFVTLTYSTENLPPGGSLSLRDVQLFMKRLRFKKREEGDVWRNPLTGMLSNPIRFFLAGEYGEQNARPHYHALLFNCDFRDKLYFGRSPSGEAIYTSVELSDLWSVDGRPLGYCSIGAVTIASAKYCAKYALKRLNVSERSPDEAREAYERRYIVYDADGVVYEREREFAVMSRRPGIGRPYYDKYGSELRNLDSTVVEGRSVRPARYYDECTKKIQESAAQFGKFRRERKRVAVLNRADNTDERLRVKERIKLIAAEKKESKL